MTSDPLPGKFPMFTVRLAKWPQSRSSIITSRDKTVEPVALMNTLLEVGL